MVVVLVAGGNVSVVGAVVDVAVVRERGCDEDG